MQDIRAQLAEILDEAEWNWLLPHAKRDAVIMVTPGLDLLDVGVAIASDDVAVVQRWIAEQQIYKPSITQLAEWFQHQDQRFQSLIVQPYVLVQAPS